jgi:hypothetical protein
MYGMTLTQYQQGMDRLRSLRITLTTARHALEAEQDSTRWPSLEAVVWGIEQEMQETETLLNGTQNK